MTTPEAHEFIPQEQWLDAFEVQATDELRLRAKRYANRRARGVANAGGIVDDYYARALVQDALGDTLAGVVAWDPESTTLLSHVLDVIKSRTRHDRIHATRFKHYSVDVFDPTSRTMVAEIEVTLARCTLPTNAAGLTFAGEVIQQLRTLARDDTGVLKILDAFSVGATEKSDVMHIAQISPRTYHNARHRLVRLAQRLSSDFQPARKHG